MTEPAPGGEQPPNQPSTPPPPAPGAPAEGGQGQQQPPQQPPAETDAQKAARLERELASTRAEAARYRTRNDQESQGAQAIRKALVDAGLLKADEQDPQQLAQQVEAMREENRTLKLNQALDQQAQRLGAVPRLLRALVLADPRSRTLDPANQQDLESLAKAVLEENPEIKANGQAPARTSSQGFGGTQTEPPAPTAAQFKSMVYADRVQLHRQNPALYEQLMDQTR